MQYDIIIITGEMFFDHPLCGAAILKRLLEKEGYKTGIIEKPQKEEDTKKLGKPKLFFGISSGSIDSMVRNYTPLKKQREKDKNLNYKEKVPDRAVIVYSNWIKKNYKETPIVLGGTEASLRRFTHYDYWDNKLRRPINFDARADITAYGNAEKQILEIAKRTKNNQNLEGIEGTCIIRKKIPEGFTELPSHEEASKSKERFCDMQNNLTNKKNLAQKIDNRYLLQYKSPKYTTKDLDEYYSLDFTRKTPKEMEGFEFSIVTHRGCIGRCSFCAINLLQGDRIISRTEESILKEIKKITKMKRFKGNIDDLGGATANMYGMDCGKCENNNCIDCNQLDRSNKRIIELLRKARKIKGVKKIIIRSGIRYDLATDKYLKEIAENHILNTLRIAPEHVNKKVLRLMNKDKGDLKRFIERFKKITKRKLSYYFMTAHPGSSMKEAKELAEEMKRLGNTEKAQVFTPTPMTRSTCMYYTSLEPETKRKVYIPYTYAEKKEQKRVLYKK